MFYELKKKIEEWFKSDNFAIFIILLFFLIFSLVIIARLYNLQIVKGEGYREDVVKKSKKLLNNKTFDRGKIYFRDNEGYIPVAIQKNGYYIAIDNIKNKFINNNDPEDVFKKIKTIIKDLDKKYFFSKSKKGLWKDLKYRISLEDANKIRKLKIKGLFIMRQSWREYPLESTGGKIIGYIDINKKGANGLEKYYDKELFRTVRKNKKNIFLDIFSKDTDDFFEKKSVVREGDLYTTIDVNMQMFLENKLKEISKKYSSKDSLGIIIKPSTGEIIAMADDNSLNFNNQKKDYRNKIVESRYEPGSIIKPLIVAMGLDSKSINTNFSYTDRGCMLIQGYKVCNYDKKSRGDNVGLVEIIKKSLNLGMVTIQKIMKKTVFLDYFLKLGLSEESGIDLPGEVSPNISSLNYNIDINYATASFGQGISSSPISILRSLSVIANDGFLVNPHIMKEINYGENIPSKIFEIKKEKVLKTETVENIKNIMVQAVNQSELNQKFQRRGYSVAVKTGTAQVAAKGGGYKKGKNIHAFFGFFPVTAKPEDRYAVILYTFEPRAKYSSETLTKPFYDILDYLISYYNIKPDKIK